MNRHRLKGDVSWRSFKNKKRRSPISWSTKATSDFLAAISEMYPDKTINEIRDILLDKTQWIYNPEAVKVLSDYIKYKEGDIIPRGHWR